MTIKSEIRRIDTLFIDTAPIIYFIESHPQYGPIVDEVMQSMQRGNLFGLSSVITLTEVLPKPTELKKEDLVKKFITFLKNGQNFELLDVNLNIAELAGRMRGMYPSLKTIDAIQLATAIEVKADAFLTNDLRLKQIREIRVICLKDFLKQ
ncbi:MAG: PIN domain-containing protein [bacterium]|nr:PIN domain-containing protein [bacterium]